jgi:hypothetical protein
MNHTGVASTGRPWQARRKREWGGEIGDWRLEIGSIESIFTTKDTKSTKVHEENIILKNLSDPWCP